jgi:OmpA-OmpF porin, OOP family
MIKNATKLLISVAAFGFASAASAQMMSNTYIGAGVGSTNIKLDSGDFSGVSSKDESDTGFKIFAGYRFNPSWAAEVAYANLGDSAVTFPGGTGKGEASSWSAAAVYTLPLTRGFSLLGKLGASFNKFEGSFTGAGGGSSTKNKTDLLWGIGASYAFSPRVSARLEWEDYGKFGEAFQATGTQTGRAKVDMLSASIVLGF